MSSTLLSTIILNGAPGAGKTTLARHLKAMLNGVLLDLDWIRSCHLDASWSNASSIEEDLSYRILERTIECYRREKYAPIILCTANLGRQLSSLASTDATSYKIFTLTPNEGELAERILDPARDSGWRDVQGSVEIQRRILSQPAREHETRVDTSGKTVLETAELIISLL
jgi:hypothetical protein